jgi:AcrR family transcriptional regulator
MAVAAQDATGSTKGDRTRQRLLEIAVQRFAADGYRRTSVSDIARDAGLSPASTYAYFRNKEALFEAAVDYDAGALVDRVRAAVSGMPVAGREAVVLAELAGHVSEHPLAARVLAGREPEVIDRLLDLPSLREFNAQVTEDIAAAQRAGEVRADVDPAEMANGMEAIVLSLLMGFLQARVEGDSRWAVGALSVLGAALRPPA